MSEGGSLQGFSRLRVLFWPIHGHELKKLIPMLVIFSLLAFNYNVLRCLKDTLVITAEKSVGAAVIPFIKVWAMFPASILLTLLFLRLSSHVSREAVFYVILSIFLIYFASFALFIYPAKDLLYPHASADWLAAHLPVGWRGFVTMYRYWTLSTFYVMAEMWGPIVLSVLFWGFSNQITRVDEAKRFYGIFGIGINVATIFAGLVSIMITQLATVGGRADPWTFSFNCLIALVVVSGLGAIALFRWLNKVALKDPLLAPEEGVVKKKEKPKYSMRENLRFLTTAKYVLCIAAMIFSYNMVINLVEVLWKQEIYEYLKETQAANIPSAYNLFMNEITTMQGILATFVAIFISGNAIRKLGWTQTALITPILLLVTSVGFFGFFFLKGNSSLVTGLLGVTPLALVVFFGSLQNVVSRTARYTLFDVTKEMAFIPLNRENKIKAKAAIDGVCNRFGKSGGSVIYNTFLIWITSIEGTVPFVAPILFGIISVWMVAVKSLGKQFNDLTAPATPKAGEPIAVTPAGQPAAATL